MNEIIKYNPGRLSETDSSLDKEVNKLTLAKDYVKIIVSPVKLSIYCSLMIGGIEIALSTLVINGLTASGIAAGVIGIYGGILTKRTHSQYLRNLDELEKNISAYKEQKIQTKKNERYQGQLSLRSEEVGALSHPKGIEGCLSEVDREWTGKIRSSI